MTTQAIAIIPARGGSKRIPRKNVREFAGRPIISWPIAVANACGLFDRVVVSTDDEEIRDVALACGAEVPFLRPDELSDDHTVTVDVVAHALGELLSSSAEKIEFACCMYPTSVFLESGDLENGWRKIYQGGLDYVLSVARLPVSVERSLRLCAGGRLESVWEGFGNTRTQDLPPAFYDCGQMYWGRREAWLERRPILGGNCAGIEVPRNRAQDIDEPDDWLWAESIFRAMYECRSRSASD